MVEEGTIEGVIVDGIEGLLDGPVGIQEVITDGNRDGRLDGFERMFDVGVTEGSIKLLLGANDGTRDG